MLELLRRNTGNRGDEMDWNNKLVRVMGRVWDIMVLNLLLLLCSLPVFTFGAAVTAVYDMSLRLLRGEESGIVRGFFRAFRSSFKQATQLWLIGLAVLAVSAGDLLVRAYLPQWGLLLTAAAGVQAVAVLAAGLYAFPLLARYENTLGGILHNSAVLAVCCLPETLLMGLLSLSAALIFLFLPLPRMILPCFITLCLILWFAGVIYLNAKLVSRIFQRHFHSEQAAEEPQANYY